MSIRQKTASNRASVIHCGELFRPGSTQPVKSVFKAADRRLIIHCNPGASQTGKKRKTSRKSKTPGALIYNVPGSRSGGIPLRAATDMVATPHCGARFLSVEKGFDEISSGAAARSPLKTVHWTVFRAFRTHWRSSNPFPTAFPSPRIQIPIIPDSRNPKHP